MNLWIIFQRYTDGASSWTAGHIYDSEASAEKMVDILLGKPCANCGDRPEKAVEYKIVEYAPVTDTSRFLTPNGKEKERAENE